MARKKAKANYFTKETEEYIVRYTNQQIKIIGIRYLQIIYTFLSTNYPKTLYILLSSTTQM